MVIVADAQPVAAAAKGVVEVHGAAASHQKNLLKAMSYKLVHQNVSNTFHASCLPSVLPWQI